MNCPICHEKKVTVGHILGHGGTGKPKTLPKAARKRLSERMAFARQNRWPAEKKKAKA